MMHPDTLSLTTTSLPTEATAQVGDILMQLRDLVRETLNERDVSPQVVEDHFDGTSEFDQLLHRQKLALAQSRHLFRQLNERWARRGALIQLGVVRGRLNLHETKRFLAGKPLRLSVGEQRFIEVHLVTLPEPGPTVTPTGGAA